MHANADTHTLVRTHARTYPMPARLAEQVLDDGRITDGQGRTVDFKNTIIIFTSNIGSQLILDVVDDEPEMRRRVMDEVKVQRPNSQILNPAP